MYYLCSVKQKTNNNHQQIKALQHHGKLNNMTQQEFTQRTGFYPTVEQFDAINKLYMERDKDKDAWCKEWKSNGGVEQYSKESALEIDSLRIKLKFTKIYLDEKIERANMSAEGWMSKYKEATNRIEELESELKKWKGVVASIQMIIPQ